MSFNGLKIRPLLREINMSVADFNVAMWPGKRSQLSHLERCENVTSDTLERLCSLTNVPMDYWFNDQTPADIVRGGVIGSFNVRSQVSVEHSKDLIEMMRQTLEAKEQVIREKDERIALLQRLLKSETELEQKQS